MLPKVFSYYRDSLMIDDDIGTTETHSLSVSDCFAAVYALQWLLRLLVEFRKKGRETRRNACPTFLYYKHIFLMGYHKI